MDELRLVCAEDILVVISNWQYAKRDLNEKLKECQYDASYFLAREMDEVRECEAAFGELLNRYIDQRIAARAAGEGDQS